MKYMTWTRTRYAEQQGKAGMLLRILFVGLVSAGLVSIAQASPREQAKRIHDRLSGVPPTESVLSAMEADIQNNNPIAAAYTAMDNANFYNVTLKNFAAPWTNEAQ